MSYEFSSGSELSGCCRAYGIPVSEVMLRLEVLKSGREESEIIKEMSGYLSVMRSSIDEGLDPGDIRHGMIAGGDALRLHGFAEKSSMGADLCAIAAASMAVAEVNASMGRIIAAPTAGASGIVPAVLITGGKQLRKSDDLICRSLFTAGAIGRIIALGAGISGAAGGCQQETGTAASMAAGAFTELRGGSPDEVLTAASIALKNVMGLVCDPVGGLVECPCVKRNAMGAVNAVLSSDMALAGITSFIPFDDVVSAVKSVGELMHPDLKETGRGGLAGTKKGLEFKKSLRSRGAGGISAN